MRSKIWLLALVLILAGSLFGQTALTSTTLASAVAVTDDEISVASATGIAAATGNASSGSFLVIGPETVKVMSVSGTVVKVQRGYAGKVYAHPSGAVVYEATAAELASNEPYGVCSAGVTWPYTPLIVPGTGRLWDCVGSLWVEKPALKTGTAATSITAGERGDASNHITKLTFSGITVVTSPATGDEAGGVLLYTFPSGVINVRGASISVALTGSGTACDADTPDMGLGTVIGTGDVATLDGTGTFENILTGQTVNDLDGTAEVKSLTATLAIESAGAHTVYLNAADGFADACTVTAAGTVYLDWSVLE